MKSPLIALYQYDFFNSRPDLQMPVEISMDDNRELCRRQLFGLVRKTGIRLFRSLIEDPSMYFTLLEVGGSVDISLGIKIGIQYSSFSHSPLYGINWICICAPS